MLIEAKPRLYQRVIDCKFVVPREWIEACLGSNSEELFRRNCIGYWARGIAHRVKSQHGTAWLIWESDEKCRHGEEPGLCEAMRRFEEDSKLNADKSLPKWHVIDSHTVLLAWLEGLKLKGERWFDYADGSFYDVVLQKALFGSVRYG